MRIEQANKPFDIQVVELVEWKKRPLQHNFFEVVFVEKGTGTQCINYNEYTYQEGSVFLLPPLKCHSFKIKEPTKFIFVKFTGSFFKREKTEKYNYEDWFKEASYVLSNYRQQPGEIIQKQQDKRNLINLIQMIVGEIEVRPKASDELIKSIMVSILHILLRSIKEDQHKVNLNAENDSRLNQIMSYIQENLDKSNLLQIENLANQFFISKTYLGEFFLKKVGVSLREYIITSRLKLVEIRLLHSEYTLSEIAEELGFSDASHLSKIFKKYTRLTIKEFRENKEYVLLKRKPRVLLKE